LTRTLRIVEYKVMQRDLGPVLRFWPRLLGVACLWASLGCTRHDAPKYLTELVTRGDVRESILATGEVSALTKVNVGSQVSGTVSKLLVDYNSAVKAGQVLAEIDPRLFWATLQRAEASVAVAESNVEKARVGLLDAERTLRRLSELVGRKLVSQADVDTAEVNRAAAVANLKGAEAGLLQARADRDSAATNLAFTKIRSPIDGIVIDRQVDVGQTVAAQFQVATLFVIANDLRQIQILANIDEADIGKVHAKMPATFTVDAYPDDLFSGVIRDVRLAPTAAATSAASAPASAPAGGGSNVVTYAAVLEAQNPDYKLRQGMTAQVSVQINDRRNVLRLPAAALRYKPKAGADAGGGGGKAAAPPRVADAGAPDTAADTAPAPGRPGRVFRLVDGAPRMVDVRLGVSDGHLFEVLEGVAEGDALVVGEVSAQVRPGSRRGPF
jgi:HlyD family secretion protein